MSVRMGGVRALDRHLAVIRFGSQRNPTIPSRSTP